MGTEFKIILYAPDRALATRASAAAFKRIGRLDAIMSDYRETSELMLVSKRAVGRDVKVSRDLYAVLKVSKEVAARSNGAFDVTVGPVVRLWRRARRTGQLPPPDQLSQALELTGYRMLHLNARTRSVKLDRKGMLLDLGGIAKGYAIDRALDVLKRHGIQRALVAGGGDIVVGEAPPGSRGWVVGVAPMESTAKPPSRYISLRNAAVSTSGDAEQFVEIGGVRYSHIVDPRTGIGVTGPSSVTVVAPNGTSSDALATAASVLGPSGLKLVDAKPGAAALFIQGSGDALRIRESKRWRLITQAPKPGGQSGAKER
jgi:thiamine biosynthesis lipoprotein